MKTVAKITKIGNSKGVRVSSKDLVDLGVDVGDEVEIFVTNKKHSSNAADAAKDILSRYDKAFKNLSKR